MPSTTVSAPPPIGDAFALLIATAVSAMSLGSVGFVILALVESPGGDNPLERLALLLAFAGPFGSIWAMGHYWTRLAGQSAEAAKIGRAASSVVAFGWMLAALTVVATADLAIGSSKSGSSAGFVFFLIVVMLCVVAAVSGYVARRLEEPLPVGRVLGHSILYGLLPLLALAALLWASRR